MNYPGHGAVDPCGYRPDVAGGDNSSFADMIWDYSTTDDLFGLEWEKGGEGGGAGTSAAPGSSAPPEVRFGHPPSEEEMAAWLRAIVKGEEPAFNGDEHTDVPAKGLTTATVGEKEKLPMAEEEQGMGTKQQEMRKTPPLVGSPGKGRSSHSHHHREAHKLKEKRRRSKISERFRTLQQLIPGCDDKCNQASTLDRTIQYVKWLQHQVHAMCVGPAHQMAAAYPVVQATQHGPPAAPIMPAAPVVLANAPTMVPFRAMIQLPHYTAAPVPAGMMHAAAAAPLYPAEAAAEAAPVAPGGARSTASHRQGSSRSKGNGSSRSLRQRQRK